jgi:hypothetical protein
MTALLTFMKGALVSKPSGSGEAAVFCNQRLNTINAVGLAEVGETSVLARPEPDLLWSR